MTKTQVTCPCCGEILTLYFSENINVAVTVSSEQLNKE